MRVIIVKNELIKSLQLARSMMIKASKKDSLNILSNVLLDATGKELQIIATDLEHTIKIKPVAEIAEEGATTVEVRGFIEMVRGLPSGDVVIDIDDKGYLNINSLSKKDESVCKMKCMAVNDFPALSEVKDEGKGFMIPQHILKSMIMKTEAFMSEDELQGTISGIKFEVRDKKLRLVATDARRLAMIDCEIEEGIDTNVIVPAKSISILSKILATEGAVRIDENKKYISFDTGSVKLISRLIDGRFPDYKQVIPVKFERKIDLPVSELYDVVKSIVFLYPKGKDVQRNVTLAFIKNRLTVSGILESGVKLKNKLIKIIYESNEYGDEFEIRFHADFLLDALKVMDTEMVQASFNANTSASLWKEKGNKDFTCLLMPVRMD